MAEASAREPSLERRIAALAFPALGVLAAEPIYLLFDIAIVGRLGALSLAGLAIGGLIVSLVGSQLTFLSTATTARSARFYGVGDRKAAVAEGVQATWLAIGLGLVVVAVVQLAAVPVVAVIAGPGAGTQIAAAALPWLRIAILAVPAILISLAGNGWMRGIQDTVRPLRYVVIGFGVSAVLCPLLVYGWLGLPRWGLVGSAVANLVGQWLAAVLFCRALLSERVPLRLDVPVLRAQLVMGRDLVLRTMVFQACFVSAAAVAARFGAAALAAHQVVLQLWSFLALVLDSLAIAAQSLVGAALGGGDTRYATQVAWRVTKFSAITAVGLAAVLALGASVFPSLFTGDRAVLAAIGVPWWFLVAQLPVAGVLFALDGVLLGAGDATFMRNATLAGALLGFLPLTWLSLVFGWGLAGIWSGLTAFVGVRLILGIWRVTLGRWKVPGQWRPPPRRESSNRARAWRISRILGPPDRLAVTRSDGNPTMTSPLDGSEPAVKPRRDRTHWLYVAVIVAVVVGVIVGLALPGVGRSVGVLGTMFVDLIKMMITPVIFCTIVIGVGSVRKAATVGKIGGLAFAYFMMMSTVALSIGLVVGNLLHPGDGLKLSTATATKGAELAGKTQESGGAIEFIRTIIPTTLFSALTAGNILQALFVALLVGFAIQALGRAGEPILHAIEHLQRLVFKILSMVLWLAPIGAFGAIANLVAQTGWSGITQLLILMLGFYVTCVLFVFGVLGMLLRVVSGVSIFKLVRYLAREYLLIFATASSESALPRLIAKMEHLGVQQATVGVVVPTGYSFNLDGTAIYLTMASLFIADAMGSPLSVSAQISLLVFMIVASKGAAGVSGAGLATLAGGLQAHRPELVEGIGLIVGIDRFMSEARAVTNFSGNAVATLLVGTWTRTVDMTKVDAVLSGRDPFDENSMVDERDAPAKAPA